MQRNRSNMMCRISLLLLLILTVEVSADDNRFFISAPGVFHVGVQEKVFVQMGKSHLNNVVTLYLEHETTNTLVSEKKTVTCYEEENGKTVELMILPDVYREILSRHKILAGQIPYLLLIAESHSLGQRKNTKVLVSQHRGYIFIQTNQPLYKPTQTVQYRIFTLDHKFRPHMEACHIAIYNAAGNKVMTSLKTARNGVMRGTFIIPDTTKTGTWKIKAYYDGDQKHAASREFKVQKFLLPSFEVNIAMEQKYILLNTEQFDFTILAKYSHGEQVTGAYHCMLGVIFNKVTIHGQKAKPVYIKGLDLTGSVKDGVAELSLRIEDLNMRLQNQLNESLSDLQNSGLKIYLGVFVTNIQSGEIQERDVSLPIIAHRYTISLSRTRSYFIPGFPLDVVVSVRHPDGSPAAGVPVTIELLRESWEGITDQQGTVFNVFNLETATEITVEVSVDGQQQRKVIRRASSPGDSFLYLSVSQRTYSVDESLTVTFNTQNAPNNGFIHYMILSRGTIIKTSHLQMGTAVRTNVLVTAEMMPFFRLIGYFYNQQNNIIADSVWIDVKEACELKVEVTPQGPNDPGRQSILDINLYGQQATVALLGVDKAFYGLNADNKLTPKQVYSSMESYDLGCSYSGGSNPASVLVDAGLTFFSQSTEDAWRRHLQCNSQQRLRRSVNLQQEMITLKSNFSSEKLQDCCVRGFTLLPMSRTCQERIRRVSQVDPDPDCAEVFLKCCLEGERLRQIKINEEAQKGFGRTSSEFEIEDFFLDSTEQYIRRIFPPSIAFTEFEVNGRKRHSLTLPDSITTWEIQVVTLSATTGLCVVQPSEIVAFKRAFVSLTLPYSVKKYEQISIAPVIYNYGDDPLRIAVHMEQTQGLCSPGSATAPAYVEITVKNQSSQFVSFSAVPMTPGSVPIKIRLYDVENERGIDAIEKTLNVWTEGFEQRKEAIYSLKSNEKNPKTITIDGSLPGDIVPESKSNIFASLEANGFGNSYARNLLFPAQVAKLIVLPKGCLEQTMRGLSPTVLAVRYLDMTNQWFTLPSNSRDDALHNLKQGVLRILNYKKPNGSYGIFYTLPSSTWVTALVVKVLSMVAERQRITYGLQDRRAAILSEDQIRDTVRYLVSIQNPDGTFGDKNPVLHRGVLEGTDHQAAMTAFVALALNRSLIFLQTNERNATEESLLMSTSYLESKFGELEHPYAVAITAYYLSICKRQDMTADRSFIWTKLQALATQTENGCSLWPSNAQTVDAITIETTAYALLTAVAHEKYDWADKAACWLTTQENYFGGYKSSQDTVMTLEALAEYALMLANSPDINAEVEFTVQGKNSIVKLELENKWDRVETELKRFVGNQITAQVTGEGDSKLKIVKVYHILEPKDNCDQISVKVTAEGKVKYSPKVVENYEYYFDDDNTTEETDTRVPRSAIEWFDARTRNKRDVDNNLDSEETLNYTVCVSFSTNLTGMAIADITLLSGFEVVIEDLERLKHPPERYISHYEVAHGRVLIYFDELFDREECISFDAVQRVPIGLLQPAPAVFYDYYEPDRKCTVFYSAPKRSKLVSTLCSEDVCQCAERPCHKLQNTFRDTTGRAITKDHRRQHACFFHNDDYAYIVKVLEVSVKSHFELYKTSIAEVLRSSGDRLVSESSVRVFAKRLHCKGQLDVGVHYLIMGKDGTTTDSDGEMQYLLEADTWVEKKPLEKDCRKSAHRAACTGFDEFTQEYKMDGCRD